ncbi:unnamed protein product [Clonostachys rhizophaga]|uniref:C2H2-type domain-containing protein n=1 Tax=Clonostachys rhizophaga TaxID=160324 RepID=A0A9N9YQV5_9HYPO|nr:unnamed protein product [Clonostachys rhizophaga]
MDWAPCSRCDRYFNSPSAMEQHIRDSPKHNLCGACNDDFELREDLEEHCEYWHDYCRDDNRFFDSAEDLDQHDEGTCISGVDQGRVTELAFQCRLSQYYASSKHGFDFECPSCNVPFSYMSGLFQHVQSEACDEESDKHSPLRAFLRFLRRRV